MMDVTPPHPTTSAASFQPSQRAHGRPLKEDSLNMQHKPQSEDASLEENSKWLRWLVFSVLDTAAKRGLSFKGRYFSTIDRGGCLSDGEIRRSWGVCFRSIADLHQRLKTPKNAQKRPKTPKNAQKRPLVMSASPLKADIRKTMAEDNLYEIYVVRTIFYLRIICWDV